MAARRIVIIGAGYGGMSCAMTLASKLKPSDNTEVLVVEKSKYLYHTMASPRALVDSSFDQKLFIPYDHAIAETSKASVKLVRGVATQIAGQQNQISYHAINDDNDKADTAATTVDYDYLVIATGSTYSVPIKQDPNDFSRSATEAKLQEVREKIEKAERILIVGGGVVGCEVAGEIASKYPNKSVTILESKLTLVGGAKVNDKFRKSLLQSLQDMNVKVITGERLSERLTGNGFESRSITTDKGTKIESDLQLLCGGFHPTTELVKAMDPSLVTDSGFIKVNAQLQVEDPKFHNIFVLGDASNHGSPKMAMAAAFQGAFLADQLVGAVRNQSGALSKSFPIHPKDNILLSLGPNNGVAHLGFLGGVVMGSFFARRIKSKDMFVRPAWSQLNAPPTF